MHEIHVLSSEAFKEVVLSGLESTGRIEQGSIGSVSGFIFEPGIGGVVVRLIRDAVSERLAETPSVGKPVQSRRRRVAVPTVAKSVATETDPEILRVKEALSKRMERVPSIATIRNWTDAQRKMALNWANDSSGEDEERPEFIVEPKPRGPRAKVKNGHNAEATA